MQEQPAGLYRRFLREALNLTWQRKSLWVFGIFASLISTGGVVDLALASFKKARTAGSLLEGFAQSSFVGYDVAAQYIRQLGLLGSGRTAALVGAATVAFVLLATAATLAQGALVIGLAAKKPEDALALKTSAARHFWPLLTVAILNKIANTILMMVLAIPLFAIFVATSNTNTAAFFTIVLLLIPALIIVQILYQFTLIGIARHGYHALHAVALSWRLFARHWLSTIEYGAILFCTMLLAFGALIAALVLLTVPYAIIVSVALLAGSTAAYVAASLLMLAVVLTLAFAFIGATVTFQYAAWCEYYRHGLHPIHGRKTFSKILRAMGR